MAKALATIQHNTLAVPLDDAAVSAILFSAQQFAVRSGGVLQLQNMPTESERQLLLSRLNTLREAESHDRTRIGAMIATMLAGFPAAIRPNEDANDVTAWYVQELELPPAVPTWAVERACLDIRLGHAADIGPRTYPRPSTLAVRKLCDAYAYKARCEAQAITDVLRGRQADPVLTPAERETVAKFWIDLSADLKHRTSGAAEAVQRADQLRESVGSEAWEAIPDRARPVAMPSLGKLARSIAG